MNLISISYAVYWELDFAPHYQWTKCGKCFNSLNFNTKNGSGFYFLGWLKNN